MACVLPFLIVPVAIGDISPDFDARAATERGLRLLSLAQQKNTAPKDKSGISTRFVHAFGSGERPIHFEVRRGEAFVRFSARTGQVEVTFHPSNLRAGSQNLDRATSEGIARAFIKKCGWDGDLILDPRRGSGATDSSEDYDFLFYPQEFGIRTRYGIRIELSRVDGSIISSDFDAPGLPADFKSRFNSSQAEEEAIQSLLELSGSRELRMSDAPKWSIQRPPSPRSAEGKAYRDQYRKGLGIVVFSVGAAWPSKETPGCYDFLRLNYDGTTGHFLGRELISAKLLLDAGGRPYVRDPQELPWKDGIDKIRVSKGKRTTLTEGQIYPAPEGKVSPNSPFLNLRFSDRLLVVRFDRNQGLVEVEGRIGRPSMKLLDALHALTAHS